MIANWVARIQDQYPALLEVSGAAGLTAAKAEVKHLPAAYVVPSEEHAGNSSNYDGGVRQLVQMTVTIHLVARNRRDASGQATEEDMEPLIDAVILALCSAESGHEVEYKSGQLVDFTDQHIWWELKFSTYRIINSEESKNE